MQASQTLIDKAVAVCGSAYALAKQTGFSQGTISNARSGKRPAPRLLLAEAAKIAGEDPRAAVLANDVASESDPNAQQRLAALLGIEWRRLSVSPPPTSRGRLIMEWLTPKRLRIV